MNSPLIEEQLAAIESALSTDDLLRVMQGIAEELGFVSFSFIDNSRPHDLDPFYFGTSGNEWEETYHDNAFVGVDPALRQARRTNKPFLWAEIVREPARRGPKSQQSRLMEAALDQGFTEGLVVPCHFQDSHGRYQSASGVYYWSQRPANLYGIIKENRWRLHLLMIYFIQRTIDLHDARQTRSMPGFNRLAGNDLSDRERDVLSWCAQGKTSVEIADILEVSDRSIEVHLKHAMQKLNARNRTAAVALAIRNGCIRP